MRIRAIGVAYREAHLVDAGFVVLMPGVALVAAPAGGRVAKIPGPGSRLVVRQVAERHPQRVEGVLFVAEPGFGQVVEAEGVAGRAVERAEAVVGEVGYAEVVVFV